MRVAKLERVKGKRRKPGDEMFPTYTEMKQCIGDLQHSCDANKVERILLLEATINILNVIMKNMSDNLLIKLYMHIRILTIIAKTKKKEFT